MSSRRFKVGTLVGALAVLSGQLAPPVGWAGLPWSPAPAAWAEMNGTGQRPAMGWSSWSFLRKAPSAANVEAEARALVKSGLASVGYDYVNLDDFWYSCTGPDGPIVDNYGRWIPNWNFPAGPGGESGIKVVADYVHRLGLKFGLYVTPGISAHATDENTIVLGPNGKPSGYRAGQIAGEQPEQNYNCGGMYSLRTMAGHAAGVPPGTPLLTPGAQDFLDSWADQFASWGVDYLKLDGVGSFDIADVVGWSEALRQTHRPIHLELSNNLAINDAGTWASYTNGWRTGPDIECYQCEANGSSFPLTDWANLSRRFDQVAMWSPHGGPGAFNDYDSIEVGNGANDGLTLPERQTQLSLWSLASSPLLLGTDLTHLSPVDLELLKNKAVISVDQDGIDAKRVEQSAAIQVFAKRERGGDTVLGVFNLSTVPRKTAVTVPDIVVPGAPGKRPAPAQEYRAVDLWSGRTWTTSGLLNLTIAPHGVELVRLTPQH